MGVVEGPNGVLYGAAETGGTCTVPDDLAGCGLVFELTPPAAQGSAWTYTIRYTFNGPAAGDGFAPYGPSPLLLATGGVLYGTTELGGAGTCSTPSSGVVGCGTVYQLSPPKVSGGSWTESVLYSFTGQNGDGAYPGGGLIRDASGALYGTTVMGGASAVCLPLFVGQAPGCGTVFKLTPPSIPGGSWTEAVLYSFAGPPNDGANPESGVVLGANGTIYGTTSYGGPIPSRGGCKNSPYPAGCGMVFELTPSASSDTPWTESILHLFSGRSGQGVYPYGPVTVGANGMLYGTTRSAGSAGHGTVFQITLQ